MAKLPIATAFRSFIGHLEGTEKAHLTVGSYKSDLSTFQKFLESGLSKKAVSLEQIRTEDLKRYSEYLHQLGLKTNTRRRKLLTVRRFLKYLTRRGKMRAEFAQQLPTPYKVEKIPETVPLDQVLDGIQKLPQASVLDRRNRVLLWALAETGARVSEIAKLRFDHCDSAGESEGVVKIAGKGERTLRVSAGLANAIRQLKSEPKSGEWIFVGFNKFGPLGSPITSRGIELLLKHYGPKLGFKELTPRTIRHSAVLSWHRAGVAQKEIQDRLGLRTDYAFRVYQALFKQGAKQT